MSYKDAYDEARRQDQAENINVQIVQFQEEGQQIFGEFLRREHLEDSEYDAEVYKYLFDTDHGRISFVGGQYFDGHIGCEFEQGDLLRVEFLGKQEIGEGKSVRRWNVEKFGEGGEPYVDPVTDDQIPD